MNYVRLMILFFMGEHPGLVLAGTQLDIQIQAMAGYGLCPFSCFFLATRFLGDGHGSLQIEDLFPAFLPGDLRNPSGVDDFFSRESSIFHT